MIASVLSQVTGQLEKRFLLNAFFPVLIFGLLLLLAFAAGANGVDSAVDTWEKFSTVVKTLLVIGAVTAVFLMANIVANGALWIVQLFEGYAAPRTLAKWGQNRHHKRAKKLLESNSTTFQAVYPVWPRKLTPDDVAATRLGNLLSAAETYPQDRYGLDAVRLWPRLYHIVPDGLLTSMAEARASMEFLLVIALLAGIYAPVAGIYLIVTTGPIPWFLASLLGGAAIAFLAYWGALTPAAIYGDHIRTAFDLYRLKLLEQLRLPKPATLDEEHHMWPYVTSFLEDGHPYIWRYVQADG
jgi:hypothetical protein